MKTLVSSLLLILLTTCAFAQQGWVKLNIETIQGVNALCLWKKDTVWGLAGRLLLRTTDGGATWDSTAASGLSGPNGFADMQFSSRDIGFLLPYDGSNVYKTTDGGVSWIQKYTGIYPSGLLQLHFMTKDSGWILGRSGISRTTDAGETWNNQLPQFAVKCCAFADTKHGCIMGNPINVPPDGYSAALAFTADGGEHWTTKYSGIPRGIDYVTAISTTKLVAVGDRVIAFSNNAGVSWDTARVFPGSAEQAFFSASFPDSLHGTAVGSGGYIIHTLDGGLTWIKDSSGVDRPLFSVAFADSLVGYAAGFDGILKTTNGGLSWVRLTANSSSLDPLIFPLPATQSATITYFLPQTQYVTINLYDCKGTRVMSFPGRSPAVGKQELTIDVSSLPAGTYIYEIQGDCNYATGKLIVTKLF